jgi:hypothetical protein
MWVWIGLACSILINGLVVWYIIKLLRKFLFISETLSDLYLTFKSFDVFTKSLYSMEMFYGEPMIQELMARTKEVLEEVEGFREVFEYTLDEELEEELNVAEKEIQDSSP